MRQARHGHLGRFPQRTEQKKAQIQMVFQHTKAVFNPRLTLEQSVREPCHIDKILLSQQNITEKMAMVGLGTKLLKRYPSQLSGGELQLNDHKAIVANVGLDHKMGHYMGYRFLSIANAWNNNNADTDRIVQQNKKIVYNLTGACFCKWSYGENFRF